MALTDSRARLEAAQHALAHTFAEPALLEEALVHASATGHRGSRRRNNERLEFLGDRVLGLVVAEMLFNAYAASDEGGLTQRHAALVRRETLAAVAREVGLADWLVLNPGEEDEGGRAKPAILADACEALIGALYLDGGIEVAERFIRRHWQGRLQDLAVPPRDAKTALQMWALARGLARPSYTVAATSGPAHRPRFQVVAAVDGHGEARGEGGSKRTAEQAAADRLLARLGETDDGGP